MGLKWIFVPTVHEARAEICVTVLNVYKLRISPPTALQLIEFDMMWSYALEVANSSRD